jgi:hypothetical protein
MKYDKKDLKIPRCVNFDGFTIDLAESYAREHGLNFSAVIRFIVNKYFIDKKKGAG